MGVIIDRMQVETIAHSVLTREFLGTLVQIGDEPKDPVTQEPIRDPKYFPPIERPIQERYEWWKERGIVKHPDDGYPYYYALGKVLRPYLIAEIGLYFGASAMAMAKGSRDGWLEIYRRDNDASALNMARNVTVNGFDNEQYVKGCVEFCRQGFFNDDIMHNLMVFDTQAAQDLPLHMIELFHVDGDHEYKSALHDLEMAARTMVPSPRGVILVDDVGWARCVMDAVNDFCAKSDWEVQHILPKHKGLAVLTRK